MKGVAEQNAVYGEDCRFGISRFVNCFLNKRPLFSINESEQHCKRKSKATLLYLEFACIFRDLQMLVILVDYFLSVKLRGEVFAFL